jgi:tRNA1Val (adenine37-N6)-methyltransferase
VQNKDLGIDTLREKVRDTLFEGEVVCWQHKQGYRFSIDSILLAHFTPVQTQSSILDLGAGCGVLGLILLYRHANREIRVTGIEKQTALCDLARLNIMENDLSHSFNLIASDIDDIKQQLPPESFPLVISNPPFYSTPSGRKSCDTEALVARHQQNSGLQGFVDGAAYCVKNRGRVVFIYPARLLADLIQPMVKRNIEPKKMRFIYSYPEHSAGAKLVLIEGIKNGGTGLTVDPPCYIYQQKNGPYSENVQAMYKPATVNR